MELVIYMTDEEQKILETDIADIKEWVENFIRTKINTLCHRYILEMTDRRPDRMSYSEKIRLVNSLGLKRAIERKIEGLR